MRVPCNCCKTTFLACAQENTPAAYCERCEVAYLEFKLRLLIDAYRQATRKVDEV